MKVLRRRAAASACSTSEASHAASTHRPWSRTEPATPLLCNAGGVPKNTTRRVSDDRPVVWAEAVAAWAAAGRPVLEKVAGSYNAYVTYQQLADEVQVAAGITTGVPFRHWIGQVLGAIATEQQARPDEPFLTSLVVRADGTIGDGYGIPVAEREGLVPEDLEMHAAEERLQCYRYWRAALPDGGGVPTLTHEVKRRRDKARKSSTPVKRPVCPNCFLQLPATGVCDSCAS